jgi:lysophospholipase L1-like esterase
VPTGLPLLLAASLLATPLAILSTDDRDKPPSSPSPVSHPARAKPKPKPKEAPTPPEAAILGDSYTSGANASSPRRGYAERLARTMGWTHAEIRGLPGAGYSRPSVSGRKLRPVVRKVVKTRPPIVVLVMGHNDSRTGPGHVEHAARWTLGILRRKLPDSRIVVVGPIWQSGDPPLRVLITRDAIRAAVREVGGLRWIDPIDERWFTGDRLRHTGNASHFISSDDNHPNDAGHAHIARLLLRDLERIGIRPAS